MRIEWQSCEPEDLKEGELIKFSSIDANKTGRPDLDDYEGIIRKIKINEYSKSFNLVGYYCFHDIKEMCNFQRATPVIDESKLNEITNNVFDSFSTHNHHYSNIMKYINIDDVSFRDAVKEIINKLLSN